MDDLLPAELVAERGEETAVSVDFGNGGIFPPTIPIPVGAGFVRDYRHVVGEEFGIGHAQFLEGRLGKFDEGSPGYRPDDFCQKHVIGIAVTKVQVEFTPRKISLSLTILAVTGIIANIRINPK